jgi:tripartite-type tricarboxylate transporter receptor subunit TctC
MIAFTRRQFLGSAGALLAGAALPAFGQAYPGKPVRFIVPFPPGGPVDTTARGFTHKLSEYWGQQAIVDNRAGAGGIVGAEIAAKSPADGYTVFVCSIHHSVLPGLKPNLPYDIEKDFVPVTFAAMFPIILVAHPSVPAKTIPELIAYAKKNPGKLAFGSAGTGGGTHLAGELFKAQAGVDLLHVPYKGSAPAMTDLLGGQVQLMFSDAPTALPHIKSGRVRALGVASPKRSALVPDLPTIAESGVKGYEAYSWAGVVAPAGTPAPIVAKLNADISKALSQPDVKQRLFEEGAEAMPTTPEQFGKMLKAEIAKWTKVVKDANIKAD